MTLTHMVLDASCFKHARSVAEKEFIMVLCGFIRVFEFMQRNGECFVNCETKIRDVFWRYLQEVEITNAIRPFMFFRVNKEVEEKEGRLDLKIERLKPYTDPKAYFSIECKRIDGKNPARKSGLNAKYVKEGIDRYRLEKYTAFHGINGMFGFVVAAINIEDNVNAINLFLSKKEHLTKVRIDKQFEESYLSKHITNTGKNLSLYHLMFDFHESISQI